MNEWISPRRVIRWGRWALVLGVVAALGTFLLVPVRVVVPATGIVKGESVSVAARFDATVSAILVQSDGVVSKGAPIIVMDTSAVIEKIGQLKSNVNSFRSSLKIEDIKLELQALERQLQDSVVYAPADGVIELGELEPGRVAYAGRFLFRVHPAESRATRSQATQSRATRSRMVEIKAPEEGYEAFAPNSAVTLTDSRGRHHAGRMVFRGERVRGTRYPYVICHATFDTHVNLPLGSRLEVEAVHYRGALFRCLFLPGMPDGAMFRFGR